MSRRRLGLELIERPRIIAALGRPENLPSGAVLLDWQVGQISWGRWSTRACRTRTLLGTVSKEPLSARFRLHACLISAPGAVSHQDLFDAVWGDDPEGGPEARTFSNLVHVMLNNWMISATVNGIYHRKSIKDWLGFYVETRYDELFRIEWYKPPVSVFSKAA